jgi:hypothetical protein
VSLVSALREQNHAHGGSAAVAVFARHFRRTYGQEGFSVAGGVGSRRIVGAEGEPAEAKFAS